MSLLTGLSKEYLNLAYYLMINWQICLFSFAPSFQGPSTAGSNNDQDLDLSPFLGRAPTMWQDHVSLVCMLNLEVGWTLWTLDMLMVFVDFALCLWHLL